MIHIDLDNVIDRPVEKVWAGLISPTVAERWMSGVLQAVVVSEGPLAVGARVRKVQRFMGMRTEIIYEIAAFEPTRKLAYRTISGSLSGALSYRASITLAPFHEETQLTYQGRGDYADS